MQDREVEISVEAGFLHEEARIRRSIAKALACKDSEILSWQIVRKSLDARSRVPLYRLRLLVNPSAEPGLHFAYNASGLSANAPNAIVIGFGPAGMFAALELIRNGIRPIILERGSEVRQRRRDVVGIYRERKVDPESNYCFGEGGAGTFSDGKLYTRSTKRGNVRSVLETLVRFGADPDILIEARPHIGTNKLPEIVVRIREAIRAAGGEVHFNTRVDDLILQDGEILGVRAAGSEWQGRAVILATGHSARDIFELLERKGVEIEAKPFALGVRVEHPQELINRIQYKCAPGSYELPPASYNLVRQVRDRGVFSFCMCPGGIIAPAMTNPGEVVVNGWSPSKRNGQFANSGFVVQVEPSDWQQIPGPEALKAMLFQQRVEQVAFEQGGGDLSAPAQSIRDFLHRRSSGKALNTSYIPGVRPTDLRQVLPGFISDRIDGALRYFGKIMPGYAGPEGILVGVESRTSSPVKIPRDRESLEHPFVKGLYPCGEGAGYAGGIVSAALDGIACAAKVQESRSNR
ncbi:MAG: FAD-binding protein [Flavobacteriales bacterium]|nr:FAD-binding protein [Flavobacteriales bacterium]